MINLYLIRHVESVPNLTPDIICGQSSEAEVTATGRLQAQQLGRTILGAAIMPDFVMTSPALRAIATAEYSLKAAGISTKILIEPDLHEASQGDWEGLPRAQYQTTAFMAEGARLGKDLKAPGGESINDVTARGQQLIDRIAQEYASDSIIFAYTHGLFTRALAGSLLGWQIDQIIHQPTPNASNTLLQFDSTASSNWRVAHVGTMTFEA